MNYQRTIILPTIKDVYDFHKAICKVNCDVDMLATNFKYCVDAKSIMGIFSMDLTQPVIIKAYTDIPEILREIDNIIKGREVD